MNTSCASVFLQSIYNEFVYLSGTMWYLEFGLRPPIIQTQVPGFLKQALVARPRNIMGYSPDPLNSKSESLEDDERTTISCIILYHIVRFPFTIGSFNHLSLVGIATTHLDKYCIYGYLTYIHISYAHSQRPFSSLCLERALVSTGPFATQVVPFTAQTTAAPETTKAVARVGSPQGLVAGRKQSHRMSRHRNTVHNISVAYGI